MRLINQLFRFSQVWLFIAVAFFVWNDFKLNLAITGAIIISQIWAGVAVVVQEMYKQETPELPTPLDCKIEIQDSVDTKKRS